MTDAQRLDLEDALDLARILLVEGLRDIGLKGVEDRVQNNNGCKTVFMGFRGRDEAGHACNRTVRVTVYGNAPASQVIAHVGKALGHHVRMHERAGGRPPIEIAPDMPLDHLLVNAPLAARLRIDHGDRAQTVLRDAILQIDRNARMPRNEKGDSVPYGIVLTANVLDHREDLSDGVRWAGRTHVVRRTTLPDSVICAYTDAPLSAVCDHPILADEGNRVLSVKCAATTKEHTKGTTVFEVACANVPGNEI